MNRRALVLMTALVLSGSLPLLAQTPASKAPAAAQTDVINLNTATTAGNRDTAGHRPEDSRNDRAVSREEWQLQEIEEIMNVKGIGEKSFLKLKSRLQGHSSENKGGSGFEDAEDDQRFPGREPLRISALCAVKTSSCREAIRSWKF